MPVFARKSSKTFSEFLVTFEAGDNLTFDLCTFEKVKKWKPTTSKVKSCKGFKQKNKMSVSVNDGMREMWFWSNDTPSLKDLDRSTGTLA